MAAEAITAVATPVGIGTAMALVARVHTAGGTRIVAATPVVDTPAAAILVVDTAAVILVVDTAAVVATTRSKGGWAPPPAPVAYDRPLLYRLPLLQRFNHVFQALLVQRVRCLHNGFLSVF